MEDGGRGPRVRLVWAVPVAVAGLLLFTAGASAQATCEAEEPSIDHVAVTGVSAAGAAVEAQINPHGKETAYEFLIVWQSPKPPHGEPPAPGVSAVNGRIAPAPTDVAVTALMTGLQHGYLYGLETTASNAAGKVRSGPLEINYFYGELFPEGSYVGWPYRPEPPCWASESGNLAAEKTLQEQRAKEAEEAAARRREEEAARARAHPCRVPDLRGHTLRGARLALDRANCRLGSVRRPGGYRGALIVTRQSQRRGRTLAYHSTVSLTLGPARHRRPSSG